MKILLVCHYYPPEIGAPQARLSEMVREWVAAGHEVEVLTGFPNHPTGVIQLPYRGRKVLVEDLDGARVIRTWLYATPNEGFVRKTLGHLSFLASSVVLGWRRVTRPDVVVISSPTFFSILSAYVLARRFRARFVLEVRDLWPGIFVELGVLRNKQLIWLLERLELAAYRAADRVVVVTQGFKDDLVRRGIPATKVEVITNGVDLDAFTPGEADPAVRHRLGGGDYEPLVVYIGAHGISHGLDAMLDAAEIVGHRAHFAFVGEGARKAALVERGARMPNVTFLNGVPRAEVLPILRAADILLVPLRDVPGFASFIPSKMFEFMAAGTPVVGAVAGEAARILEAAGAPVVAPEDGPAMAAAILRLIDDPGRAKEQAQQARDFVEANYDRSELARRYEDLLLATVEVGR